jgi:hypothetical protein
MLLAASVLPYVLLIRHTVQFGVRTYGSYPGLDAFVHSALVMTGTLVLLSLLVARWRPLTAAFLPVALFTCHRLFVARQLHNQLPGEPLYDNGPSIAFLAVTAGATAFLVWFVRSSPMNRGARRGGAAHRPPGGLASENG